MTSFPVLTTVKTSRSHEHMDIITNAPQWRTDEEIVTGIAHDRAAVLAPEAAAVIAHVLAVDPDPAPEVANTPVVIVTDHRMEARKASDRSLAWELSTIVHRFPDLGTSRHVPSSRAVTEAAIAADNTAARGAAGDLRCSKRTLSCFFWISFNYYLLCNLRQHLMSREKLGAMAYPCPGPCSFAWEYCWVQFVNIDLRCRDICVVILCVMFWNKHI